MKTINTLMAVALLGGSLAIGQGVQAAPSLHPGAVDHSSFCTKHSEACNLDYDHAAAGSCSPYFTCKK